MSIRIISLFIILFLTLSCSIEEPMKSESRFADDLSFLSSQMETIVLSNRGGTARVIVIPQLQGRIMTSTLAGENGLSIGWINKELVASGETLPHFNPYGGEDRFWLGPEGGQFSIFFKKESPFDLTNWYTPSAIDTEPFELVTKNMDNLTLRKSIQLINYSGTRLDLEVERQIRLLDRQEVDRQLKISSGQVDFVAFESENKIINSGSRPWNKETGLLSIWILGMFNPSPHTTVVIPFKEGREGELGPVVNDRYFGKVPVNRLGKGNGVLYFKGDGEYRSKIGISQKRAKPVIGSYDAMNRILTLVQYTLPEEPMPYVNSMWEIQDKPYDGDVVNSYNDGPPEPGAKPLGPFYELETSSPAGELAPGQHLSHIHRTIHFQGPEVVLDPIAKKTLGVDLQEIKRALL